MFELAMPDQASSTAQGTDADGLETLRLSNGYVRHVAGRGGLQRSKWSVDADESEARRGAWHV